MHRFSLINLSLVNYFVVDGSWLVSGMTASCSTTLFSYKWSTAVFELFQWRLVGDLLVARRCTCLHFLILLNLILVIIAASLRVCLLIRLTSFTLIFYQFNATHVYSCIHFLSLLRTLIVIWVTNQVRSRLLVSQSFRFLRKTDFRSFNLASLRNFPRRQLHFCFFSLFLTWLSLWLCFVFQGDSFRCCRPWALRSFLHRYKLYVLSFFDLRSHSLLLLQGLVQLWVQSFRRYQVIRRAYDLARRAILSERVGLANDTPITAMNFILMTDRLLHRDLPHLKSCQTLLSTDRERPNRQRDHLPWWLLHQSRWRRRLCLLLLLLWDYFPTTGRWQSIMTILVVYLFQVRAQ